MTKTLKKILILLLCTLVLASTLASCATNDGESTADNLSTEQETETTAKPSGNSSSTQSSTSNENVSHDINEDTYKEQISYYMALTETLQAELLKLKEESYIDECEYQLKISTLEDTVDALKKTIASLSENSTATQSPSNDNLSARSEYKYTEQNGKVTITAYTGSSIDVNIPSKINGMPVVAIGDEAFRGMQIRNVTIPSGVKEIGWFAFSGCTVLESVTLPSSVTSIGYGAFDYCPKSLKVICEKNSYAEAYAISWGMKLSAK